MYLVIKLVQRLLSNNKIKEKISNNKWTASSRHLDSVYVYFYVKNSSKLDIDLKNISVTIQKVSRIGFTGVQIG